MDHFVRPERTLQMLVGRDASRRITFAKPSCGAPTHATVGSLATEQRGAAPVLATFHPAQSQSCGPGMRMRPRRLPGRIARQVVRTPAVASGQRRCAPFAEATAGERGPGTASALFSRTRAG